MWGVLSGREAEEEERWAWEWAMDQLRAPRPSWAPRPRLRCGLGRQERRRRVRWGAPWRGSSTHSLARSQPDATHWCAPGASPTTGWPPRRKACGTAALAADTSTRTALCGTTPPTRTPRRAAVPETTTMQGARETQHMGTMQKDKDKQQEKATSPTSLERRSEVLPVATMDGCARACVRACHECVATNAWPRMHACMHAVERRKKKDNVNPNVSCCRGEEGIGRKAPAGVGGRRSEWRGCGVCASGGRVDARVRFAARGGVGLWRGV